MIGVDKIHFSWKSKGNVVPKGPVRTNMKTKGERSNRIAISKMLDAERKELT